jgi:hypothetical protein
MFHLSDWWMEKKLNRRREKMRRDFERKFEQLRKNSPKDRDAYQSLQADEYFEEKMMEDERNDYFSHRLLQRAPECDVEVPPLSEKDMWQYTDDGQHCYLSLKGRDLLRDRIARAKDREAADWTRRSRIAVPIIGALAALFGAATGLVLAFKK